MLTVVGRTLVSNIQNKLDALMRGHGLKLVRKDKHAVYRSKPDATGRTFVFVTSSTPSDAYFTDHNRLKDLQRAIRESQQSEVVAISNFERAEADAVIAAHAKKVAQAAGAAGTRKKSQGTGLHYIDGSETRR